MKESTVPHAYIPWKHLPGRMLNATSAPEPSQTQSGSIQVASRLTALRERVVRSPKDYGIELPE
ncbi:MAG: hypothetical protein H8E93_00705, partial [Synechococcus sp.]|nr:hypothetical protein [Synechococcus sp.]